MRACEEKGKEFVSLFKWADSFSRSQSQTCELEDLRQKSRPRASAPLGAVRRYLSVALWSPEEGDIQPDDRPEPILIAYRVGRR